MRNKKIKLLIVDDSGFMRIAIRKMVERAGNIEVIAEAGNGRIALEMAKECQPDVITMDVEMPEMDGLEATREIMRIAPKPIIMVSSMTQTGAETTIKALELGAVDFLSKSSSYVQLDIVQIEQELVAKINYWANNPLNAIGIKTKTMKNDALSAKIKKTVPPKRVDLVVIGVSTGGPKILPDVLRPMGVLSCPVVVAQHMPDMFTGAFANRLNKEMSLNVVEGRHGMELTPGMVVIAKGGTDSVVHRSLSGVLVLHVKFRQDAPVHPWIDPLFQSALRNAKSPVAVILTGMGSDGTKGAIEFSKKGLPVLAQEPDSCVVDGMPSSAINAGAVTDVLSLDQIGGRLAKWDKN